MFRSTTRWAVCLGAVLSAPGCARPSADWSPPKSSHRLFREANYSGTSHPEDARSRIRIGAWNIQWLGSPLMRLSQPDPNNLAAYILFSGVSILGLEEMALDDAEARTNNLMTQTLKIVDEKSGGRWAHRLFRTRNGPGQLTGIAWDQTRVKLLRIVELRETDSMDRIPHAAYFSTGPGRTDFAVVVIHLKANYEQMVPPDREQQARQLVEAVRRQISEPDLLLIGDFNCHHRDEPALRLCREAGFLDLNDDDERTFTPEGPLDRGMMRAGGDFAPDSFQVVRDEFICEAGVVESEEQFVWRLSDHFMVTVDALVGVDDD